MNWKKRIIPVEDGFEEIDLQNIHLHSVRYDETCEKTTLYDDYTFTIPVAPPDSECINYGLSEYDQIFRKVYIPKDLQRWEDDQKDAFIDAEWHRRLNGCWIFIKGNKYYIPGPYYFFLNYWSSLTTDHLLFRYVDLEFFWMWMLCVNDPKCLGLISFKCRQLGETEKCLAIIYEYITRSKKAKAGMQSIDEEDIIKTYGRMVHAHGEMIFYMKATHRGTSDPADGLYFDYQREVQTKDKMRKNQEQTGSAVSVYDDYEFPPLNSSIEYGPTKPHVFGTGTYRRYYMDEFGKFDRVSPLSVWSVVREAMFSRILSKVLGKAIFTSTVEDLKAGETLRWSKTFWKQSDPKMRTGNGMTLSGLYRVFRGAKEGAHTDRWGYAKGEEAVETIKNTKAAYISTGDMKGLAEYTRKNALTIDDVFKSANQNTSFDIDKLATRQLQLDNDGTTYVRGNLRWKDDNPGTGEVIWEPNSKGRWCIARNGHPKDFNCEPNSKTGGVFRAKPGNTNTFCMGVDPYEQKETTTADISMGGIAVKAKLNSYVDKPDDETLYHRFTDEKLKVMAGDPFNDGANFKTNRYVCSYLYRWKDPNKFYEDVIMTAVYYGTEFLPEKNKAGGLLTYLDLREHELYLMQRPTLTKNAQGKTERDGVTATDKTIDEYFGYLMTLSCHWTNTIDIPDIIEQLLTMNWDNRGEKDLGVAVGWCEYASKVKNYGRKKTEEHRGSIYYHENMV